MFLFSVGIQTFSGAVVLGNPWWVICTLRSRISFKSCFRAILHDPVLYPEPDIFKPERFLNVDGSLRDDPILVSAFGFGKRLCPGRHFADATLFISIVSLLSVFNIERGKDGGDKRSDYTYTGALVR
jgi:cytochrome P450